MAETIYRIMAMESRKVLALVAIMLFPALSAAAEGGETLDFRDVMTPVCEIEGLAARPPAGWFNVPIESEEAAVSGCQMMRARHGDDALVGIARLLSVRFDTVPEDPPWWRVLVALETENIHRMGYVLGEALWSSDEVPVRGGGFTGGQAVGFAARIEGNDARHEAHFVMFERNDTKYVVTLLTPGPGVEEGVYFDRNVADFGVLMGGFIPREE